MPSEKQPTMQQIADAAGVSRMAVSLALRNSPKISPETSQRIRDIAEKLGYRPNPLVSALMTQLRHSREIKRPSTIAYVTAYPTEDGWRRPGPFAAFYQGAQRRAEQLGYTLEHWWLRRPGMTEQRFCDILSARGIHGMIVAPLPPAGATLNLDWDSFAAATIGYSLTDPDLHRASNHQYITIRCALRELTRLGYKRIGLATLAETDERVQGLWSAGMLVYQQQIPAENRVPLLRCRGAFSRALAEWFSEHRPDVVLTHEPQALRALDGLGLRVPEDVGLAHLALNDGEMHCSGMNQNATLVGAAAFDLVDAQLRRNERGIPAVAKTVLVPGVWVPGQTVRTVPVTEPAVRIVSPSPSELALPDGVRRREKQTAVVP